MRFKATTIMHIVIITTTFIIIISMAIMTLSAKGIRKYSEEVLEVHWATTEGLQFF